MILRTTKKIINTACILGMISSHASATLVEISGNDLFVPQSLASKATVRYNPQEKEFCAILDGVEQKINKFDVRGFPSDLSEPQLDWFLKSVGYIDLKKIGDDLALTAKPRLEGGILPILVVGAVVGAGLVVGGCSVNVNSNNGSKNGNNNGKNNGNKKR